MLWHAIGFLLVMILALTELFLAGTWGGYMSFGIPLFRRSTQYEIKRKCSVIADRLSEEFGGHVGPPFLFVPPLLFTPFGPREVAFREEFLCGSLLSYTTIMHGFIRFDDRSSTLTVTGYAYLWPLCFAALWIHGALTELGAEAPMKTVLLPFCLVFGALYAVQAYRFNRVFKALRDGLSTPDRP